MAKSKPKPKTAKPKKGKPVAKKPSGGLTPPVAIAVPSAPVPAAPKSYTAKQAWDKVAGEIKAGRMVQPAACQTCDATEKTWGHHWRGYDHPLDVWWVCASCNRLLDKHDGSQSIEQARADVAAKRSGTGESYEKYKDKQAALSRKRSEAGREIGPIPDIANVARREACSKSLKLFCDTYNPEAFYLPWAGYQLESVTRIEEAVLQGALYAMAEPRGGGKSTRCRMAGLWALSNALCRFVFIIGANADKAEQNLDAIKTYVRFLPLFAADYPEIAHAAIALNGIANRASGQTCKGESTMIEWAGDRLVFPSVPPPSNWPKHWPLRADGLVPTSGAAVATSGLTGDGIRGSLLTLTTGESIRPDLVLLDDPQTSESANSRSQNATRESLISADVLGMAGPGRTISAVMPCTVIAPDDAMDNLLSRDKHPMWRGVRTRMLTSMPTNLTDWDAYFEVYRRCALKEPPDFAESNAHYLAHRDRLDAGAVASWTDRKTDDEISAVQSAMHLYYRNPRAFAAEYQNEPLAATLGNLEELDADLVMVRVNKLARCAVPEECTRVTAFIDCGQKVLFYCVAAWSDRFGGAVIDYGTYPEQNRTYFQADDARPALADLFKNHDETARIYGGLKALGAKLIEREYVRTGGGKVPLGLCVVDAGKWTETVHQFCDRSTFAALLMPSKGFGIGAGAAPMANWTLKQGERTGDHWRVRPRTEKYGRTLIFDTNHWKGFIARRLQTPEGGSGYFSLFGDGALRQHQLFAEHVTAEYRVVTKRTTGDQREVEEWKARPGRPDNHWWDCLVGTAVGASVLGVAWDSAVAAGDAPKVKVERKKIKLSELYAAKHGGRR